MWRASVLAGSILVVLASGEESLAGGCDDFRSFVQCAQPRAAYEAKPGTEFYSTFVVPPLPLNFDMNRMTMYEYLNIRLPCGPGCAMNQFVPQLYLGAVTDGSTGAPQWKSKGYGSLSTWHIGAMYWFSLSGEEGANSSDVGANSSGMGAAAGIDSRAAAGPLIPVHPGETVTTYLKLDDSWTWTIGIQASAGGSMLSIPTPLMGLTGSRSWSEPVYSTVNVAACLENYHMKAGTTQAMTFSITSVSRTPQPYQDWYAQQASCYYEPRSSVSAYTTDGGKRQIATWKIGSGQPSPPPSPPAPAPTPGCTDRDSRCPSYPHSWCYAGSGHDAYSRVMCKHTCGFCASDAAEEETEAEESIVV